MVISESVHLYTFLSMSVGAHNFRKKYKPLWNENDYVW